VPGFPRRRGDTSPRGRRRLLILRHAKSAWPEGVKDRDRPLAPRGRRDAPAAGRWLRDAGCTPDTVVCSQARRARETWELVSAEMGGAPEVTYDAVVYEASASELLDVVRATDDSRRTLLVVGHDPAVRELALALAGKAFRDERLAQMKAKFPTSGIAVLAVPDAWQQLAPNSALLLDFAVPRGRRS
jgi:phosphohistidine phosphatase